MAENADEPGNAQDPAAEATRPPTAWYRIVGGLAAVIVVALVVALIGVVVSDDDDDEARGEAAVAVAREVATGLIDVDPAAIDTSVARLRDLTTGEFQKQFNGQPAPFATDLRNQGIRSEGVVLAAGLGEFEGDTAQVALVGRAKVTTAAGEQERGYQLIAQVVEIDGEWLVSQVEVR